MPMIEGEGSVEDGIAPIHPLLVVVQISQLIAAAAVLDKIQNGEIALVDGEYRLVKVQNSVFASTSDA